MPDVSRRGNLSDALFVSVPVSHGHVTRVRVGRVHQCSMSSSNAPNTVSRLLSLLFCGFGEICVVRCYSKPSVSFRCGKNRHDTKLNRLIADVCAR